MAACRVAGVFAFRRIKHQPRTARRVHEDVLRRGRGDGLRVSPMFPGIARRNEAVEGGAWVREIGFGLFALVGGLMLCAVGISLLPWIEQRKKPAMNRKARRARNRVSGS
ncbi:hypothetical protein LL998_02480 [Burkholderia ambifaria]|uniref:hypothetical protein n=1 Tax=Burkholderia ambifaria TaxID=152480 RepID=UPI001E55B55B|nr:hypothetical protein [Burkholderia ambifaria]UEP36353.1 hypothetical protein LL998_02480 [Burkholderia ambifaria]